MVFQNLSAIIFFLLQRLTDPKGGRRFIKQKRNYSNEHRIFLRRMRMVGSIPHPIFCRKIVDFPQIKRILFAKSIQLQKLLGGFRNVATFKYQGELLRLIKNYFATYLGMARPFCIKFGNKEKNNVIVIQFKPENHRWFISFIEVNLDTCCSNTFHHILADVLFSYKLGVKCLTRFGFLSFLYNKKVTFNRNFFIYNYFTVDDVEFYIRHETAAAPLIVDYPVLKRKKCEGDEPEQLLLSLFSNFRFAKNAKLN
jgi:hypothetical protein